LVEIANRSNLINSFGSGILQTDNHRLYKTPTYYAQQLYATRAGARALAIESDVPANFGLDLSATLAADGRKLVLFAVNDTPRDITRPVDLSAFGARGQRMRVWTLADRDRAGEPDARNSFGDPARIRVQQKAFRAQSPAFEYCFPALSLTVLEWRAGR
jgi:alpha-L-arabinofuranosidase